MGGEGTGAALPLLPTTPRPATDERLSSWLSRLAAEYLVSVEGMLTHLGLPGTSAKALEDMLPADAADRLPTATGLSRAALEGMSFRDLVPEARSLVAARRYRLCARFSPEADHVLRKSA